MATWKGLAIPQISRMVEQARDEALNDSAEYVLETANRSVPIEESTLQRSGDVDVEDGAAAVSYDTPYARVQHERTNYRHDPGRRAKWLEHTVREEAMAVRNILAEGIKRRLR